MQKWRASGPEGKQRAVTIRGWCVWKWSSGPQRHCCIFHEIESEFYCLGQAVKEKSTHRGNGSSILDGFHRFNKFPFFSSTSADLNISSGMNVCVGSRRMHAHRLRLCNSITLHLPWCVAHAVQTQTNFSPSQTPARRWISFSRFKQSLHTPEAHTSEPKPMSQPCMTLTYSNLKLWNGCCFLCIRLVSSKALKPDDEYGYGPSAAKFPVLLSSGERHTKNNISTENVAVQAGSSKIQEKNSWLVFR